MAIVGTHLTTDGSTSNVAAGGTYTTASVTLHANQLGLLGVTMSETGSAAVEATVSGLSTTWVQVGITQGSGLDVTSLYRTMVGSDQTGTITLTVNTTTHEGALWTFSEFSGVDTSGTFGSGAIVQNAGNAVGSGTNSTITLSSFADAVNNAAYIMAMHRANEATTASDVTLLGSGTHNNPSKGIGSGWQLAEDTDPQLTWTTSAAWRAIGVEIKAAAATPTSLLVPSLTGMQNLVRTR